MLKTTRSSRLTTTPLFRRLCASALLTAVLVAGKGQISEAAVFNPETFTLDNGMQVVVITNRRAPVVTHHVWYRIGSSDSPPGKSGLPHFHEHLMFKATKDLASGEFSKEVARNGGNENAFTGPDYTGYFQTIAKDRLELVMRMEADRMTNLVLAEDEVLRERDVVLEERSMRVDNNPSARFSEQMNAAQFLHHPYRMPVIGWRHEIEAYTREDSLEFYRTWYAPNNAILLVAGDIDAAELKPLAEKYYGSIPAREIPERVRVQEPPQAAARTVTLRDERVRQPSWLRFLHGAELHLGREAACLHAHRARGNPGRHQHVPPLSRLGDRAADRDLGRGVLPWLLPRSCQFQGLCEPEAGCHPGRAGGSDRCRARASPRRADHR